MKNKLQTILAVDFGGTRIRSAMVTADGSVHGQNFEATPKTGGTDVIDALITSITKTLATTSQANIRAIGLAAPGPLDSDRGIILKAPNISNLENTPIADPLSDTFGVPVYLGNDANLAALAEHSYGIGQNIDNMVYMTVSTGIGGGIISDGKLLEGSGGNAGEIGQMTVDLNDRIYSSGNIGTVEGQSSGDWMARYAEEQLVNGVASSLIEPYSKNRTLTGHDVVTAYKDHDCLAKQTWNRSLAGLGAGIVSFIHVLDPELVIIGGGITSVGDQLFKPLRQYVNTYAMPGFRGKVRIEPWSLGEQVGILGAAVWARNKIESRN